MNVSCRFYQQTSRALTTALLLSKKFTSVGIYVSPNILSLQHLIDYDTEISQILLKDPIRSLEGIGQAKVYPYYIDHVIH